MKNHFENKYIDDINFDKGSNYFTPILNHILKKVDAKKICDIGCGNGVFTVAIKDKIKCQLIGVDSSEYALHQAKSNGFDETIKVNDLSSDILPIESNSQDLVICKDVLEHLINPVFLIEEISRILKNEGLALLHVPNHFPIWGRLKFLFTNNIDTFSYFPNSERFDFPHIRFFTTKSISNLIKSTDLVFEENLSYYFVQPRVVHRLMPLSFKKLLSKISTNNFSEGITYLTSKKQI